MNSLRSNLDDQLKKLREESEERDAERRAAKAGLPYLDLGRAPIQTEALKLIPKERAEELQAAAFQYKNPHLALAVVDPENPGTKSLIKELEARYDLKVFVGSLRGMKRLWQGYQFVYDEAGVITSRFDINPKKIIELQKQFTNLSSVSQALGQFDFRNAPLPNFFELFLSGALANRASDIHFEPTEAAVRLRFRVDGLLNDIASNLDPGLYHAALSRTKLLAGLKLNVQDRPQDGRFTIGLGTKEIEIRVAVSPSEFGEIIVMRILDPDAINLTLEQLGIRKDDLEIIVTELKRPNGMILNTGPTGSGKTSTLYAFLRHKYNPEIKIITIEDPIEYHLAGIEQTQVNEEAGYTFANGLRSIMRQDPDVILVGEIRDKDTAEIGIQAALTGHLVFSTVHANDAAGAIPRLLDLGVNPTSVGPALNLIIAQRLVRRLCEHCKAPKPLDQAMRDRIKKFLAGLPSRVNRKDYENPTLFDPKGCERCNRGGYKGRIAIFELLLNDPEYQQLLQDPGHTKLGAESDLETVITKGAVKKTEVEEFAFAHGMVAMKQDGVLKVLRGITTLAEVEEITGPIVL